MKSATIRSLIWTLVFGLLCAASVPVLRRTLPKRVELAWNTEVEVAPGVRVSVDAHRREIGNYSTKLPVDNADIRLAGSTETIHAGPNVFLCMYKDRQGHTIRTGTPPDESYLSDWLKENGVPTDKAGALSAKIAEVFDNDNLQARSVGPDWQMTETSRVNPLAWVAANTVIILVWVAGVWFMVIPRKK